MAKLLVDDARDPRVEPGEQAAEDDDLGVEDVDQAREADPRPAPDVRDRPARRLVAGIGRLEHPRHAGLARARVRDPCPADERRLADLGLPAAGRATATAPPIGVDGEVPDLARVATVPVERPAVDDQPAADADLARHVQDVASAVRRPPEVLRHAAEVGLVADDDRHAERQAGGDEVRERHVRPAEVRGQPDEAVVTAHEPDDRDADAEDAPLVARAGAQDRVGRGGQGLDRRCRIGDLPRSRHPHRAQDRAAQAHDRGRERVDLDIERQDADRVRPRPHHERRPPARARRRRAVLVDEPALRELADERPDRLAVEAGPLRELRARHRAVAVDLAQDGRQVVAPDPLAVAPEHGQHMSHRTPKEAGWPADMIERSHRSPHRRTRMATRQDFSDEEWTALQRGLTGSGMLVSLSDRDFTDSFGEASALGKFLAGQQVAGRPTSCARSRRRRERASG